MGLYHWRYLISSSVSTPTPYVLSLSNKIRWYNLSSFPVNWFIILLTSVYLLGVEYVAIVEYAPFQRIPKKKKKKDPKCGTIESDPLYQEFLESLKEQDTESQPKLEFSYPVNDGIHLKLLFFVCIQGKLEFFYSHQ